MSAVVKLKPRYEEEKPKEVVILVAETPLPEVKRSPIAPWWFIVLGTFTVATLLAGLVLVVEGTV